MIPYSVQMMHGLPVHYRQGTTDSAVLREVLERRVYRRASLGFDVERGERWLDLGANVGAFALYCQWRGATAVCYEPVPENFELLRHNAPGFELHCAAVTVQEAATVLFFQRRRPTSFDKGSEFETYYRAVGAPRRLGVYGEVANVCACTLLGQRFDGVKMDVEGSEGPIIDRWWLPQTQKLVLEYHSSVDVDVGRLRSRLEALRSHFRRVECPREMDRVTASGATEHKAYFDRQVWAVG
jgi:FkbM family methyltransferase